MSLNFRDGSRYGRTTKRKKTNLILNTLIAIVFVFIIFLGYQLFFGKNSTQEVNNEIGTNEQELNETAGDNENQEEDSVPPVEEDSDSAEEEIADEEEKEKDKDKEDKDKDKENSDEADTEVTENSSDSNVIKTMTNPSWGPVGTTQSEPHASVYDEGHVDWKEKLDAVHAATGLSSSDYTLYYLGNGGSEHRSVASIKNNSNGENYKIYLEWVTGKGWKPTKVEQVKQL